jgi:type II secretory pathway pseudopilin PulG
MRHRSQRGSALIVTIIVILVMAVIGVAMLRYGSREVAGSIAMQRQQALSACADAGRQIILSQFRAVGPSPINLPALDEAIDPSSGARVVGGHYDNDPSLVKVQQVSYLPESAFGPDRGGINSLGNKIIVTGGGAKPMKVIVHCQVAGQPGEPTSGRQLEVEFGLRFGI